MAKDSSTSIVWGTNRGRNGWDSPIDVPPDQSVESRNVHFYNGGLGSRRGGSTSVTKTGVSTPTGMFEYIPGQDTTAAELFVTDSIAWYRCAGGTSFTALTLPAADSFGSSGPYGAATLNGKLYLAFDSGINRLHVFDPGLSTTALRWAGMGTPAAPTVANTGAGAYAATLRYYKVAYTEQRGGVTVRRSLLSSNVSFTPSGAGTAARVTKPAAISEGETHWELYGSADNGTYYLLATTAVGTTTYDDSATVSTYANNTAEPQSGANTAWPSVRFLGTDGNRLIGFGVWLQSGAGGGLNPQNGRLFIGPVLDSSSIHDDERISNTTTFQGWLDIARNSSAKDTGLTNRPVNGNFYAFQNSTVTALIPTENATVPYRRQTLSTEIGAMNNASIVIAQDRVGRPCAYFLDPTLGPHIVGGEDGLRWCGKDVKDIWDTFNKDASTLVGCGAWYPDRNIVIWAISTGTSNTPDKMLVLDVTNQHLDEDGDLRGGWMTWTGDFASARSIVTFSNTLAATRSNSRVPYVGTTTKLLRYNESVTQDDTTSFQAYVTSGAQAVVPADIEVRRTYLVASAQTGVTVQQSLIKNTGEETDRVSQVSLTPTGSETAVLRKFSDAALQDAWMFQVTLGDAAAQAVDWTFHRWYGTVDVGAEK